jgi:hypothetical protein
MRSSSGSSLFISLSMLLILKIIKIFKKYYQSFLVMWQHMFSVPVMRTVWRRELYSSCSSILVLLESCLQTCVTYTVCTVYSVQWINTWWWTGERSETCRGSCQNKFVKLVHLVGFIIKIFVTMRGHMNVKYKILFLCISTVHHFMGYTRLLPIQSLNKL